jgi:hypothetical protein
MIDVYDMPQGSPEWYEARRGIATASEFAAILAKGQGKMRRAYMMRLAAERITGEVQVTYINRHMQRGRELEAEAREYYAWLAEAELQQVGFVRNGDVGCSPDALVGAAGMVEVKTKLPALLLEAMISDGVPSEHWAQVQGGLWVCERQWCDLVCYWPGMPPHIVRAERDEAYIAALATEVARFNADLEEVVQRVSTRSSPILGSAA